MTKSRQRPDGASPRAISTKPLRWVLAGIAVLVLLATAAWTAGQYALDRFVDRTILRLQGAGLHVSVSHRHRVDWPISSSLILDDWTLQRAGGSPGSGPGLSVRWTAQHLMLQASLLHPGQVAVIARGIQHLRLGGLPGVTFWGDRVAAYLSWHSALPLAVPIEARALHAAIDGSGPDWVTTIAEQSGQLRFADGGNLAVRLSSLGVALPQAGQHPLGRVIDRVSIAAALPSRLGSPGWPAQQPVLVQDLSVDWASLHATLSGRLFPDAGGGLFVAPVGQFSLNLRGARTVLQRVAGNAGLSRAEASALGGLVGLLEGARDHKADGAANDTLRDLPLTLHDQALFLGRIPLWRVAVPTGFAPN